MDIDEADYICRTVMRDFGWGPNNRQVLGPFHRTDPVAFPLLFFLKKLRETALVVVIWCCTRSATLTQSTLLSFSMSYLMVQIKYICLPIICLSSQSHHHTILFFLIIKRAAEGYY